MKNVGEVMSTGVLTVTGEATLSHVARELRHRNVGSAIVVDGEDRPIGIISERELVDAVAGSRNPDVGTAQLWMRADPVTIPPQTSIVQATETMREHGVRHLPVSEEGRLVGVVSVRDLLAASMYLDRD